MRRSIGRLPLVLPTALLLLRAHVVDASPDASPGVLHQGEKLRHRTPQFLALMQHELRSLEVFRHRPDALDDDDFFVAQSVGDGTALLQKADSSSSTGAEQSQPHDAASSGARGGHKHSRRSSWEALTSRLGRREKRTPKEYSFAEMTGIIKSGSDPACMKASGGDSFLELGAHNPMVVQQKINKLGGCVGRGFCVAPPARGTTSGASWVVWRWFSCF